VGKQEAIYTLHSEVLTLPQTYMDKGIKSCTFRLGLPLEFHEKIKFLMSLGFGSREKLSTKEGDFTPRKILAAMLSNFPTPASKHPRVSQRSCPGLLRSYAGMLQHSELMC
jgi:saccharopine dehydrogenase-like NADP-dependent oxidoreductase